MPASGTRRGGLVYHWRHGWIPLDHYAALSKAHHSKSGAVKVMQKHGIDVPKGYKSDHKGSAAPSVPAGGHFRMSGKELQDRHAKGDHAAGEELARRAARKNAAGGKFGGKRPGVPFRPPTKPTEPKPVTPKAPAPHAPKVAEKPPVHLTPKAAPKPGSPEHMAALEAENRHIEKSIPGHTITTTDLSQKYNTPERGARLIHTQFAHNPETGIENRVGAVVPRGDRFSAQSGLPGVASQEFATRAEAHKYLADTYASHHAALKEAATAKAARDAKNAEANARKAAKLGGLPGPGGHQWQPHTFQSDGSRTGNATAAKVKQSFKAGNHTVHIETAMTKDQTKGLLSDITAALDKSGMHKHDVTFHVPSGDRHFRTTRSGTTGAYVIVGGKTVFINPKIANNAIAPSFEAGGHSGHFMPAAKTTSGREYTITHELGHVFDNMNNHTSARGTYTPSGFQLPDVPREDVTKMIRDHQGNLSKYGRKNNAEAYAEAFAQWTQGGPGSSAVADAFARRFGWSAPKP